MMLSNLPSDIIRIIFNESINSSGQESIHSMRLISHRWSEHYHEYLNDRKRLPVMNSFSCEIVSENRTKLITQIPAQSHAFFGLDTRSWTCYGNKELLTCYYYVSKNASDPILIERFAHLFNRCSRIKLLYWMCPFKSVNPFDLIRNSMRNVTVEKLSIEYERNTSKEAMLTLLDIIRNNKVQKVQIATCDIKSFMRSINIVRDIAHAGSSILINAQYWERDPSKFPLHRALWEEFAQLMNSEEEITANLHEYSTGKWQFSTSVAANVH